MKKKKQIFSFGFGVVGFLLILAGVVQMQSSPSSEGVGQGLLIALFGIAICGLLVVGLFLYNRFALPPPVPKWEKRRRKQRALFS